MNACDLGKGVLVALLCLGVGGLCWSQPPQQAQKPEKPTVRVGTDWKGNWLVLVGDDQGRVLQIFIGEPEGQAIRRALIGVVSPRPLTHDLMLNALTELGWRMVEVRIVKLLDDTFHGALALTDGRTEKVIDCRPSDGIALAVRANAPVRVEQSLMQQMMAKDDDGKPMPLDEAVKKLQSPPPASAPEKVLQLALEQGFHSFTLYPREPAATAMGGVSQGQEKTTTTVFDQLRGEGYVKSVRRLKELAGLKLDEPGVAQAGTFRYEHLGRRYQLTLKVIQVPYGEALSVDIEPAAE